MTQRQIFSTVARRLAAALPWSACAAAALGPASAAAARGATSTGAAAAGGATWTAIVTRVEQAHRSGGQPVVTGDGRRLWATVDVCRSKPRPQIGIRGSMPSDGHSADTMYMLFRVQYLDAATKQWADLGSGGESGFVKVGAADTNRQAGRTFDLSLPGRHSSFRMRGTVEFQWRRGSHVVLSTTRLTSGGHRSAAGAVPPGYSASTCTVSNG
jgi:hypothetical protein